MNKIIEFEVPYGILKKNFLGKYTNKIKNIIKVKTIFIFNDEYVKINVFNIDRNDNKGIHNEEYMFYYENLKKLELLEDICAINIVEKEDAIYINPETKEEYFPDENNLFLIDRKFFNEFFTIFEQLKLNDIFFEE